jgi:hypothetical protein
MNPGERNQPTTSANDPVRAWRMWFDAWEPRAAIAWDATVRHPWVVEPLAATITTVARAKSVVDGVRRRLLRAFGLPTREDQERTLFLLQRMESRLLDLEDRLADGEDER